MDMAFAETPREELKGQGPSQWLFGDDLLVLPFLDINKPAVPVPAELMTTPDGKPGVQADYSTMGDHKAGKVSLTRTEPRCGFTFAKGWPDGLTAPADDPRPLFVVTFKFRLGPIPASGPYVVGVESPYNRFISLIFDGQPVAADMKGDDLDYSVLIDPKAAMDKPREKPRKMILQPGKTYDVTVEYKSDRRGTEGKPMQANLVWRPLIWVPSVPRLLFPTFTPPCSKESQMGKRIRSQRSARRKSTKFRSIYP